MPLIINDKFAQTGLCTRILF